MMELPLEDVNVNIKKIIYKYYLPAILVCYIKIYLHKLSVSLCLLKYFSHQRLND
jgi:hypothetical protein